jgi:hypothetical protein
MLRLFATATEVDYLITNASREKATDEWVVTTYSQRNWVEVFYREAKGWLGLKEYQVIPLFQNHATVASAD